MPISLEWDGAVPYVMIHRYVGVWTCDAYDRASAEARRMVLERGEFVCFIVDMTHSGALPAGIAAHIIHTAEGRPSFQGPTIIVGIHPSSMMMSMFQNGLRVFPHLKKLFLLAESLEAARQMAAEELERHRRQT